MADRNNFAIRQITPDGLVVSFAGFAGIPGPTDGPGTYARFRDPQGVAVDLSGIVYVADTGNGVRKILRSGTVSTPDWNKGSITNAQCLTFDRLGNMFIFDGQAIRKISPDGGIKTLPASVLNDAHGVHLHPNSIAVDAGGNLYLVDLTHHAVWDVPLPNSLRADRAR